ncbi:MAG: DMT family transporter [Lachnospiraceae bacterium]|nr:DMT family transporter [Lachnospiraceae bacterium]
MDQANNKAKGIFHILLAAFGFAAMSLFVRFSGDLPTAEKAFFRNLIAAIVALYMLRKSGQKLRIKEGCLPTLLLRSIAGTIGIYANFWAISHMAIADANILNKLAPFAAIVMSIFIIGEKPNTFEIGTVITAFIGAAFIVKPGAGIASLPALVAMIGGIAAGTAYTYVRKLGLMGERKAVIVLFFSTFSCLVSLPGMITGFVPMTLKQLIFLLMAGIMASVGQLNVTAAYSYAPAKEISVFDYSRVVFAALFGFIFFMEIPDAWSFLGYVIIIATAVVKWYYNLHVKE